VPGKPAQQVEFGRFKRIWLSFLITFVFVAAVYWIGLRWVSAALQSQFTEVNAFEAKYPEVNRYLEEREVWNLGGQYQLIKDYDDAKGLSWQRKDPAYTYLGLFPMEIEYLQIFDNAQKDWARRRTNAPVSTAILSALGWFLCWHSLEDIASPNALWVGSWTYIGVFVFTALAILATQYLPRRTLQGRGG
jgi:type IV secretory pathway VirB6-like protein